MTTHTDVEARLSRAYRDMAEGDLESLMNLYEPDAVIQSAGQPPIEGADSVRAFWRRTFAQFDLRVTPTIVEVAESGNFVVVRGRATGELVPRTGGTPLPVDTWFQQIYRRQSDGHLYFWRGANGPNAE